MMLARIASAIAVVLSVACRQATHPVTVAPVAEPRATAPVAPTAPPMPALSEAQRRQLHADSVRRQALADAPDSTARAKSAGRIHFDFNRADLRDEDIEHLEASRRLLAADRSFRLRISGHSDERGPDEYNLALGLRRAAAARRWLEAHGIDGHRISIVSYGEEQPLDPGHDEPAWAVNRRAEIVAAGRTSSP